MRSVPFESPADAKRVELDELRAALLGYRAMRELLFRLLRPMGLAPEAWMILEAVAERSRSACDLAPMLGMQKGSLSRWLTRLVAAGLLTHLYEPGSLRRKTVSLTKTGRRRRQLALERLCDVLAPTGRPMTAAEREAVNALIRQFAQPPPRRAVPGTEGKPPDRDKRR